jgi:hypothetical protein
MRAGKRARAIRRTFAFLADEAYVSREVHDGYA